MAGVRTLRRLVTVLLLVMIAAIVTITTLFVIRFGSTGGTALGTDFVAVRNGELIEIYDADTGTLLQTITVQEP